MNSLERLIKELTRLPGVGEKTATRLAYHIMRWEEKDAVCLADAIRDVKKKMKMCPECFNLSEEDVCAVCSNGARDRGVICVVEEPQDAQAVEKTGVFGGVYHILHGAISPLDGIGPERIKIQELIKRVESGSVRELIIATNPTAVGETTALYIARAAKPLGVKMTRLAFGIPFGSDIEYVDKSTLARSLESRSSLAG